MTKIFIYRIAKRAFQKHPTWHLCKELLSEKGDYFMHIPENCCNKYTSLEPSFGIIAAFFFPLNMVFACA